MNISSFEYLEPYEVIWNDIQRDDSWSDIGDELKPTEVHYVGYFLEEFDTYYLFCSGYSDDDQTYSKDAFPKGCVKSIRKL